MFSHFTYGTNDLKRAERFYAAVGPALGLPRFEVDRDDGCIRIGPPKGTSPHLTICPPFDDLPATWSNGYHIAFRVEDEAAVERFHQAATSTGGYDEGRPGLRTIYAPDYFAAYARDPDGNKLQAVCYQNGRKAGACGDIISHITIGHADFQRDRAFYRAVLGPFGIVEIEEEGDDELAVAGFGIPGERTPIVYVVPPIDDRPASFGNGNHTAFKAKSRDAVDRFHATALAHGGSSEGEPGLRPHYGQDYYGAYVRDPVGNKLQAVFRGTSVMVDTD